MTNNSIKHTINFIKEEIGALYPAQETEAMISIILQHILKLSRAEIYLNMDTNVSKSALEDIKKVVAALKKYEPLQYILGETWFYGLKFFVNQHVLIPRPETEELVDWILKENNAVDVKLIDLGTGSGCIAVALATNRPLWNVMAMDISDDALEVAKKNGGENNVKVSFCKDDILNPSSDFDKHRFNIIVSNPPYINFAQKAEMLPNVLEYEPHLALFAQGDDPLIFYRRIALFAKNHLELKGVVYLEINEAFPNETASIFQELDFKTELRKDINNKNRMLKAYKNE
jgi:release factor glutamine methyltransferase